MYIFRKWESKFVFFLIKTWDGQDEAGKGGKKTKNGNCIKHADKLFLSFLYLLIHPMVITN